MNARADFSAEIRALPEALRIVLEAELAAGNRLVDVSHGFPAPPVGACFLLARDLVADAPRPAGVRSCAFPNWNRTRGVSDTDRLFFLLGPPEPQPEPPSMDEIRERLRGLSAPAAPAKPEPRAESDSLLARFTRSMELDYEKWHDGVGYDLELIRAASPAENAAITRVLLQRGTRDWREVEALAVCNNPAARAALVAALQDPNPEIRLAVSRHAPELVPPARREASLIAALESARIFGGLSQAIDEAEECHPPAVIDAVLRGCVRRDGASAVHLAALALFLHGHADEPFAMEHRPFFLRFNTPDREARRGVFRELAAWIGVAPEPYL